MKHVTPRSEKQSHTIKDVTPKGYGPTKEEIETIEEGPYSSGQLKPTKGMEDQEKKAVTSRTSTVRARDSKGVYTATMKDGKEVSRVYEESELDEAVEVSHSRYQRSHSKNATGTGDWMFTHKPMGSVDYKNSSEVHSARGSFSDAKKSAQKWAKEHGHKTVYVMESSREKMLSFIEHSLDE
jgi:hypothetical protein